jgi:hypothetical protein
MNCNVKYILISVYTGIIKHNKRLFGYPKRVWFGEVDHLLRFYGFTRTAPIKMIVTINHLLFFYDANIRHYQYM